jgi:hypothetical protein
MATRTKLDALMAQVEEMWGHQATLFKIISESKRWDTKHGQDWTFADVPYHLAYCNHDLVLRPMILGHDFPVEEPASFSTPAEVGEWN